VNRLTVQGLHYLVVERQQRPAALDERFAMRGQLYTAALAAQNQGLTDERFEPLNL
jgi:hypothetical protein